MVKVLRPSQAPSEHWSSARGGASDASCTPPSLVRRLAGSRPPMLTGGRARMSGPRSVALRGEPPASGRPASHRTATHRHRAEGVNVARRPRIMTGSTA